MALSFPLSTAAFADKIHIESAEFYRADFVETSGTERGDLLVAQIAAPKWMAQVTTHTLTHECAARVKALVEALGPTGQFLLGDTFKKYPSADPKGLRLGSVVPKISSIGANNRSLRLSGLPVGYVISVGDFMSYTFGSNPVRYALVRAAEAATASGVGLTPLFEVSGPLRVGTAVGQNVRLKQPVAKMQMVPGSFRTGTGSRGRFTSPITFQAIEAY